MVDDTPWVARAHGHEMTYQRDLVDPDGDRPTRSRIWPSRSSPTCTASSGRARGCTSRCGSSPFFTFTRIRKLPEPTFDPAVITQTALDLLAGLDDHRPIRLLGVRGEMVPPEGGY